MKARPDLLSPDSPEGLEIYQLTHEPDVNSCHIYMESQIFTPDSRRMVLHQHANPHGGDNTNPLHQYLLCDLADGGRLSPLTNEPGVTGPAVSPCGRYFYYFVNQTGRRPSRLLLKRVELATGARETISVIDGVIPGTNRMIYRQVYGLAAIRSDGGAIATSVFLGNGASSNPDWGLLVFNLADGEARMILHGPSWCNIHPQYCRSGEPGAMNDLLIQENHGCLIAADGKVERLVGGPGCDVHVIRDDGSHMRTLPWGRDSIEQCRGHQCWRGKTRHAIGCMSIVDGPNLDDIVLMESEAAEYTDHLGRHTPGGQFNELTRELHRPRLDHFATDADGDRLITDGLYDDGWKIHMMNLGRPGEDPVSEYTYLFDTKANNNVTPPNLTHPHPFFSPDGTMAFFNSNDSGALQAYMIANLPVLDKRQAAGAGGALAAFA